ncbi:MAG TPA: zf-TFIIB domain-containing protein, partial [Planctomycetota bacterium]|nr:zf-TFIIB domain-containing protein [Planctomycetota bacterium]
MPVLRRLVADPAAKRLWSGTFDATLARVHACAACRKPMLQVPLPDGLVLDVCKKCSLVWFDPSELEAMPERAVPPPVQEAPIAVRQRLAIEEVK